MALGGQLFRTEFVGGGDFGSQVSGVGEAVRVQRNLSDHGIIRDHHGHRPKQYLFRSIAILNPKHRSNQLVLTLKV